MYIISIDENRKREREKKSFLSIISKGCEEEGVKNGEDKKGKKRETKGKKLYATIKQGY